MAKKPNLKFLQSLGIKITPEDYANPSVNSQKATKERSRWEAESTLLSLTWPYPELMPMNCISCGERFLTNYKSNPYCSNVCVREGFIKYGLTWDPRKSFFAQWGVMEPPLIVPPAALKAMRHLLNLVDSETQYQTDNQEPDSSEEISTEEEYVLPVVEPQQNIPAVQSVHDEDQDDFLALLNALDE